LANRWPELLAHWAWNWPWPVNWTAEDWRAESNLLKDRYSIDLVADFAAKLGMVE
jgi:hypothetical protein